MEKKKFYLTPQSVELSLTVRNAMLVGSDVSIDPYTTDAEDDWS